MTLLACLRLPRLPLTLLDQEAAEPLSGMMRARRDRSAVADLTVRASTSATVEPLPPATSRYPRITEWTTSGPRPPLAWLLGVLPGTNTGPEAGLVPPAAT